MTQISPAACFWSSKTAARKQVMRRSLLGKERSDRKGEEGWKWKKNAKKVNTWGSERCERKKEKRKRFHKFKLRTAAMGVGPGARQHCGMRVRVFARNDAYYIIYARRNYFSMYMIEPFGGRRNLLSAWAGITFCSFLKNKSSEIVKVLDCLLLCINKIYITHFKLLWVKGKILITKRSKFDVVHVSRQQKRLSMELNSTAQSSEKLDLPEEAFNHSFLQCHGFFIVLCWNGDWHVLVTEDCNQHWPSYR